MPQRVTSVVFLATGVAGLLLLAGLALWRIDPEAWARTGPRWRRRLVAAGLAILAATGVAPAQPAASRPVGNAPAATAPARKDLARTPEWGHLAAAWTQAEEALHFARGLYPFDQKGQRALLDSLNLALKDVDALLAMDCLSAPEAGLLKEDLQDLIREIADRRPSDPDVLVSCYEPILGVTYHTAEAAEALSKRLLLLEKLASARTVQPEVIYKVLATAEDQVRQIDGEGLKQMPEDARAKAVQSREAAKAHLPRIRAKVAGPFRTAEQTPQYAAIMQAWKFAAPLANTGKSTADQRTQADARLAEARTAAIWLGAAGLLSEAESQLLILETRRLSVDMRRTHPADAPNPAPPAREKAFDVLVRLSQSTQYMSAVGNAGKTHAWVLKIVLPGITLDADALRGKRADELSTKDLPVAESDRDRAERVRLEAVKELARLRALIP